MTVVTVFRLYYMYGLRYIYVGQIPRYMILYTHLELSASLQYTVADREHQLTQGLG